MDSGVTSPKKVGGPNHISLLVNSKSYNLHAWDPPISKKTFQWICANLRRGLNRTGGSGPTHSPHGDATAYGFLGIVHRFLGTVPWMHSFLIPIEIRVVVVGVLPYPGCTRS